LPQAVRIVTDSNAMLPAHLAAHFGVLVASLTIVVDDVASPERDVDLATFYGQLRAGSPVATAAPSPGELLLRYQEAVAEGAEAILSIHIGSNRSATVDAARLAAREVDVPVTVVDTGTSSFLVGCCAWRAAEVLEDGADVEAAVAAATAVAAAAGSVFTIGEIARAVDGGRFAVEDATSVPVFATAGPEMFQVDSVSTHRAGVELMAARIAAVPGPLRVGVGDADAPEAADALEEALRSLPNVAEVVRYVVGPSVAAHTGAGTFGAVFHPR
jgi:DegV family protein with EDD domain